MTTIPDEVVREMMRAEWSAWNNIIMNESFSEDDDCRKKAYTAGLIAAAEVAVKRLETELAAANEVIERLVKTEHKVAQAIGDKYLLDPPDGGDVKLWEGVERIKAELAAEREAHQQKLAIWREQSDADERTIYKLREALEPLVDYPDYVVQRHARAVLEETE
jgi:hypothetical protein